MALSERERIARKARASLKRRKADRVKVKDLCKSIGLGEHGSEADTKSLANARRQVYLDLKDDVFELGITFHKGGFVSAE